MVAAGKREEGNAADVVLASAEPLSWRLWRRGHTRSHSEHGR